MSEPDYEAIGRCVVLSQRINSNIESMHEIKNDICTSPLPPLPMSSSIIIDYGTVHCIERAAVNYRRLLDEIPELVSEHNKYALIAGIKCIELGIASPPIKPTGNRRCQR